jgi:hypothetical protein
MASLARKVRRNSSSQPFSPFDERHAHQVCAVQMQQIECVEDDAMSRELTSVLQTFE